MITNLSISKAILNTCRAGKVLESSFIYNSLPSLCLLLFLGEIYCANCHTRAFGTKGYGYGIGSGVLSTDTGKAGEIVSTAPKTAPLNSNGLAPRNGCPRCSLVVYDAEKIRAVGKVM